MNITKAETKKPNTVFIEPKSTKKPFCFAAIVFLIIPFAQILFSLKYLFNMFFDGLPSMESVKSYFQYYFKPQFINASFIITALIFIALGILLLLKRSGIELTVVLGVLVLKICFADLFPFAIDIIINHQWRWHGLFQSLYFLVEPIISWCVGIFALLLLAAITILVFMKKPRSILTLLAFVPGIILFVDEIIGAIFTFIICIYYQTGFLDSLGNSIYLPGYLYPIAILLLGLWLYQVAGTYGTIKKVKPEKKVENDPKATVAISAPEVKAEPQPKPAKPAKPKPTLIPKDIPEEIKKYKELYDIGAISEEEYEEKKRQLLDL